MSDFDALQDLLKKVSDQLKKRQEAAQSGEKFNGFEICRIGDDELRHSAIIAAMLDPQGPHGLGNGPLKAFFREVGCPELADQCDDCSVETEYSIEHRRMDLVFSIATVKKSFSLHFGVSHSLLRLISVHLCQFS